MTQGLQKETGKLHQDKQLIVDSVTQGVSDMVATLSQHGIKPEQFKEAMIEAMLMNPQLAECEHGSLYRAIRKCCQDGLLPNGVDATIHSKKQKNRNDQWVSVAVYLPMKDGLLRVAHETLGVEIETGHIMASVVEDVQIIEGTGEWSIRVPRKLTIVPGDRVVGAWAVAIDPATRRQVGSILLDEQQLEEAKKKSASWSSGKDSPWGNKSTGELGQAKRMAEKTAAKSLANKLKHRVKKDNLRLETLLGNDDEYVDLIAGTTGQPLEIEDKGASGEAPQVISDLRAKPETVYSDPAPVSRPTKAATAPAKAQEKAPVETQPAAPAPQQESGQDFALEPVDDL